MSLPRFWLIVLLSSLVAAASCAFSPIPTGSPVRVVPSVQGELSFANVADRVLPGVVYILSENATSADAGSGAIMSADGYILTNRHVIEGATNVEVTLHNGAVYPIKGSWMDDTMDLAVLKINGANLPNLNFADPNTAKVGDCVLAVGHAFGLSPREGGASVTFGVISNLNRTLSLGDTTNYDVIQTDAAINPGNSGGPLVNMAGEVIGINSAYVVSAQNTAFAINVGTAAHVFTDLVKFGQPHHPYLGVVLMDTMPPRVGQIRMLQKSGALVTNVEQAQPAYLAAVRKGDIITNFAGQQIDSAAGLLRELWRHEVGEKVPIVYVRSGIAMQAEVTLADRHKSGFV